MIEGILDVVSSLHCLDPSRLREEGLAVWRIKKDLGVCREGMRPGICCDIDTGQIASTPQSWRHESSETINIEAYESKEVIRHGPVAQDGAQRVH